MPYPATPRRFAPLALLLAGFIAAAWLAPARAADTPKQEETPVQLIDRLSHEIVALLANKDLAVKDKREKIQNLAYAHIDFETLSRLTLGKNWRGLTDAQKADFIKEFRTHLANTYRSMIDNYKDEQVSIVGNRKDGEDVTVVTKVVDPKSNEDFKVDYRLRRGTDEWRIIDITIEGVSLAANFRAQFQDILSNGGIDGLMKLLREKNAAAGKDEGPADGPKKDDAKKDDARKGPAPKE
jgi:phospholipid transport system substrate-binding protein